MCNISKRLLEERKRLKKNQSEMSSLGGVAKRTYCNYESGVREPMAGFFSAIAAAGADVQYILTGVRSQKEAESNAELPTVGNLVLDSADQERCDTVSYLPQESTNNHEEKLVEPAAEYDSTYDLTPREKALLDNYRHIPDKDGKSVVEKMALIAARPYKEGNQATGTDTKKGRK